MLPAIHFDDELSSRTIEINDEIADVLLSIELIVFNLFSSDSEPKIALRLGHLLSELSSAVFQASVEWEHPIENPPRPPFQKGGRIRPPLTRGEDYRRPPLFPLF